MRGKKILTYLGVVAVVATMFKMFYGFHPLLQGWFPAILWTVAYFYYHPRDLRQRGVICYILFFLTSFFFFLLGSTCGRMDAASDFAYFLSYLLYPYIYFYFLVKYTSDKHKTVIVALLTLIVMYYAARTLMITRGDSLFIRRIINMDENMALINAFRFQGLADYSLTHAMVYMVPAYVFLFKVTTRFWIKSVGFGLIVVAFLLIYLGGASAALMMFFVAVLISFLINSRRTTKANFVIIGISLSFMLFLINKNFLLGLISFARSLLPSGNAYWKKLDDFENSLLFEQAEGDVGGRLTLYANSWDTFIRNPLGTFDGSLVGGHMYFIDLLASIGIFALLLFAFIGIVFYFTYKLMPIRSRPYYSLGFFLFVAMGCVKNMAGYDFFVVPFVYLPLTFMVCKSLGLMNRKS